MSTCASISTKTSQPSGTDSGFDDYRFARAPRDDSTTSTAPDTSINRWRTAARLHDWGTGACGSSTRLARTGSGIPRWASGRAGAPRATRGAAHLDVRVCSRFLLANLGAVQLNLGVGVEQCRDRCVLRADASVLKLRCRRPADVGKHGVQRLWRIEALCADSAHRSSQRSGLWASPKTRWAPFEAWRRR
jgi:hypothetical protein